MLCSNFYEKICSQEFSGCDTFRYYDKNSCGDLELGFIDDKKILSKNVIELKAVIRGWMCSGNFVGARHKNGYAVLFETNSQEDPLGVDYIAPGNDGVAHLQGYAV